jgi:type IV secretion system protein TrbD
MSDRPRALPIHLSLIRPVLLLGAERELVLVSAIIAAVLVLSLERFVFAVAGVVFWGLSLAVLQRIAKADPRFTRVYLRHVRYRSYYPAQSRTTARVPSVQAQMPC